MAYKGVDFHGSFVEPIRQRNALEAYKQEYTPQQSNMNALRAPAASYSVGTTIDPSGLSEVDLLARAIESEAGQEATSGKIGVGAVIANRLKSGRWGNTMKDVILAPGQFSAFNDYTGYARGEGKNDLWKRPPSQEHLQLAQTILDGGYVDPTQGALNYYNPNIVTPPWGGSEGWTDIGNHRFGTAGSAPKKKPLPDFAQKYSRK